MASHTSDHPAGSTHAHAEQDTESTPLLRQAGRDAKLSIGRLLALTCVNGGVQVFFSTVMADLSPYLQSLGLSKSVTAIITICLPLSGAFVGPMIGAYSDRLRTRFGRRRPVILSGALLTVLFLLLLAWADQLVRLIARCPGRKNHCGESEDAVGKVVLALAMICTLFMSIAVQPVQTGVRSLTVDIAPAGQQNRAWSWAGRVQGISAIFSFFASSLNLPALPGLGRLTQFQALACLNLITLGSTVLITSIFIRERDSRRVALGDAEDEKGVLQDLKHIFQTLRHGLPGKVRQTCKVQFSSWMAWFPLLYYTTTFIGELDKPDMSAYQQDDDSGGDQLAQAGSLGSLSFATVGFIFVTALPVLWPMISKRFFKTTDEEEASEEHESSSAPRDLIWLWVITQPLLGVLEIATLAAAYQWQGIVLIAAAGIPWAVTQWAPFAIVGYEVSRLGLTGTEEEDGENESADNEAGAILGVHNMAISLPQVISGLISSATYKIADVAGSDVPTAWVLASSGVAAFVAAYLAKRMV